jgi:hypothetical protein
VDQRSQTIQLPTEDQIRARMSALAAELNMLRRLLRVVRRTECGRPEATTPDRREVARV